MCESKTFCVNGELALFADDSQGDEARSKIARSTVFSAIYLCILNPVGLLPGPVGLHNRGFGKQVICSLCVLRKLVEMIWPGWNPLGALCAAVLRVVGVQKKYRLDAVEGEREEEEPLSSSSALSGRKSAPREGVKEKSSIVKSSKVKSS